MILKLSAFMRLRNRHNQPATQPLQDHRDDAPPEPYPSAVNGYEILAKVAELPVSTWRYEWEPDGVRHLGPMAQDWKAAFDFGQPDTRIPAVDANGVALVAIQTLYRLVVDLQNQVDELRGIASTSGPGRQNPLGTG
ncbi:tail fiber domain-containing protein [Microtetraspora malaysiensis]|uniref:tail fiber domain-containing protein n=1 Tax=Microtetraspora malaysiensis TaxID=161358 RepID=UPI003D920B3C